jgi:hypothetical protein
LWVSESEIFEEGITLCLIEVKYQITGENYLILIKSGMCGQDMVGALEHDK